MSTRETLNDIQRAAERPNGVRVVLTWVTLAALAYMVWLPVSNNQLLYPAIGIMAAASLLIMRRVDMASVVVGGGFTFAVLVMWLVGNLNGNALAAQHGFTILPTVLVWTAWANAQNPWSLRLAVRVVLLAGGVGAGAIVLMVGAESGWLPAVLPDQVVDMQGGFVDLSGDNSRIRFYGLSVLAAVVPLSVAGVMIPQARNIAPFWAYLVVAVLGTAAVLLSGRRAIALVVAITPALVLFVATVVSRQRGVLGRPAAVAAAGGVAAVVAYAAGDNLIRRTVDDAIFTFGAQDSRAGEAIRVEQAKELMDQFGRSPFVGHGLGAQLESGFFRNHDRPWMFELQYHQMLLNGGLLIAAISFSTVIYVVYRAISVARSPEAMPYIALCATAGAGMLAANWSNPYLIAPGHGWAIALLLGSIVAFGVTPSGTSDHETSAVSS